MQSDRNARKESLPKALVAYVKEATNGIMISKTSPNARQQYASMWIDNLCSLSPTPLYNDDSFIPVGFFRHNSEVASSPNVR